MLLNIFYLTAVILAKAAQEEKDPTHKTSSDVIIVKLAPQSQHAADMQPGSTAIAEDIKKKGLVPVRIITYFMKPNGVYALGSLPENIALVLKHVIESRAVAIDPDKVFWFLSKPLLDTVLPGGESKDEKEGADEGAEEEPEEGEGEGEEEGDEGEMMKKNEKKK